MKLTLLIIASVLISGLTFTDDWKADASQAKIMFTIKGPFGTVHGSFSGLQAKINFDEKHPESSSVSASVDAKTVSTGVGLRNSDLRKEKWFNTDKYPLISFKSKKIEKTSGGYKAAGELTMKGVTKPVEIPFTFSVKGNTGLFKGDCKLNREDFNLGKKGGSVGNEVTIHLEVPVKK